MELPAWHNILRDVGYPTNVLVLSGEVIRFDVQVSIDLLPYSHKKET